MEFAFAVVLLLPVEEVEVMKCEAGGDDGRTSAAPVVVENKSKYLIRLYKNK